MVAQLDDFFQVVVGLRDVEHLQGEHVLLVELKLNDGAIGHVEPSGVVLERTVLALTGWLQSIKLVVVEVLLYQS